MITTDETLGPADGHSAESLDESKTTDVVALAPPASPLTEPSDPMAIECVADRMLIAMHGAEKRAPFAYYDWNDPAVAMAELTSDAVLAGRKPAADLLTKARLAAFADDSRTALFVLNAGRYWQLRGGYLGYLKQDQAPPPKAAADKPKEKDPLSEMNVTYMRWRLNTFWWSFALSTASFIISITILIVVLSRGGRY